MGYLTAVGPLWQARAVLWAARARRLAARPHLAGVLLAVLGLGGMLAGGALIGEWCLGLVLIAESAGLVAVGLRQDDGQNPAALDGREHTVAEVLAREARRP